MAGLTFRAISAPCGVTSRTVQDELLDSLPHDHPDARHNRRDLRVINALMGNHRWLARALAAWAASGESILEIGAGTGELALRLLRRGWHVDGLDTWQPRDEALYRERGKKTARDGYVSMSREYLPGQITQP